MIRTATISDVKQISALSGTLIYFTWLSLSE